MVDVKPGEVFVPGTDKDTARRLLAAARGAGLDAAVVRTTAGGFVVPERIAPGPKRKPAAEESAPAEQPAEQPEPDKKPAPRARRKKTAK